MKILFISYNKVDSFNDPQKWLERIKAYIGVLESLSNQHTVISIEQINYTGDLFQNGVQYYFFNSDKKKFYHVWHLHRFIKKLNPDVVFVHGLHYPLQVMLLRIQSDKKTKIVAQHHAEKPFVGYKKYIQKWADIFIDAYLFTSSEMGEEWLKKGIINNKKKIWDIMEASSVFYPIDKMVAKTRTAAYGNPVFLWVGRLDKNKDPLTVVKAFSQFKKKYNPAVRLYMIYHTTELLEQIHELLVRENSNGSVVLIGKVLHDEMLYWYNSAEFIISGSHYEGSGVAVCEAMSCGCIPVITDIPSFKKLTGFGQCGLLYEKGNVSALVEAFTKTQQINVEQARSKVLEQFHSELSFNAITMQVCELLKSLNV
jgi:glycosyltransferase involved in cell wall biosynthesis